MDNGLLVTIGEAVTWQRCCREAFAGEPVNRPTRVVEAMERLESLLKTAGWVTVESYEWKSGLD